MNDTRILAATNLATLVFEARSGKREDWSEDRIKRQVAKDFAWAMQMIAETTAGID